MATSQVSEVLQRLGTAALLRDGAGLSDGRLLESYLRRRDAAAVAALVARHGPMVWGTVLRVLGNSHDAEDAFQATFLVLVRKAASVVPREMVGNWLYGVARQTALKARATAAKRARRERQVKEMPEPAVAGQGPGHDLLPLLDQELSRLPEKYRAAIVLCELEGKTRKEAARQFGVPEGTVAGWLTRGRALLAKRLARHGLGCSGGALAAALAPGTASACVPPAVVSSTIRAAGLLAAGRAAPGVISAKAAALSEGVLKAMLLTKLKIASVLLLAGAVVVAGAGGLLQRVQADSPGGTGRPTPAAQAPAKPGGEGAGKKELAKLQGTWLGVGGGFRGQETSEEDSRKGGHRLLISGDEFTWTTALHVQRPEEPAMKGGFVIDPTKRPRTMDLFFDRGGKPAHGKCIYELDGDTLKLCYGEPDRPTSFKTAPGSNHMSYVWKREKKK